MEISPTEKKITGVLTIYYSKEKKKSCDSTVIELSGSHAKGAELMIEALYHMMAAISWLVIR